VRSASERNARSADARAIFHRALTKRSVSVLTLKTRVRRAFEIPNIVLKQRAIILMLLFASGFTKREILGFIR